MGDVLGIGRDIGDRRSNFFFRKSCGWVEAFHRSMLVEIVNFRFAPFSFDSTFTSAWFYVHTLHI